MRAICNVLRHCSELQMPHVVLTPEEKRPIRRGVFALDRDSKGNQCYVVNAKGQLYTLLQGHGH